MENNNTEVKEEETTKDKSCFKKIFKVKYFHENSQTPIEVSEEQPDQNDQNEQNEPTESLENYRPNYVNIFLVVFAVFGITVIISIAAISLIQIHQSKNLIMVDKLFNYILIDNDATKKDTSLIFQTNVNLTISNNYTSLNMNSLNKLCNGLLENLKSSCQKGIKTCQNASFYNFISKLSYSTLNKTFEMYKFDWAKNVTAAKLIRTSTNYFLEIDEEENAKVMYWLVFGFNYNTTAPKIDQVESKSDSLIDILEKSIESMYSSCGWFFLDVNHLETIRLTKRSNSYIS